MGLRLADDQCRSSLEQKPVRDPVISCCDPLDALPIR
jgi:hypothetical protein